MREHAHPSRPSGPRIMCQTWTDLLFIHWPADADAVQRLLPPQLTVDTHDGKAWLAVVPFAMSNIRAPWLPAIPGLRATLELNVRTYVQVQGKPGVYFFSLEAHHPLVVWGARTFFHLPYMHAEMKLDRHDATIAYQSTRTHRGEPAADFRARWTVGDSLPRSEPGSLPFFLTERYGLYTVHRNRVFYGRIFHDPWPLHSATLQDYSSNLLDGHGLAASDEPPLLYHAERLDVEIWPLVRMPQDRSMQAGSGATA